MSVAAHHVFDDEHPIWMQCTVRVGVELFEIDDVVQRIGHHHARQ